MYKTIICRYNYNHLLFFFFFAFAIDSAPPPPLAPTSSATAAVFFFFCFFAVLNPGVLLPLPLPFPAFGVCAAAAAVNNAVTVLETVPAASGSARRSEAPTVTLMPAMLLCTHKLRGEESCSVAAVWCGISVKCDTGG